MTFCIRFIFNIMISRFIRVVACISTSFSWHNNPSYGYITFYVSVHQLMDIWIISTSWLLTMLLWTFMHKFWYEHTISLGYTYLGMELLGHSMFNNLRNCQSVFQSDCTSFPSYQQYMRLLVTSRHHQHLLLSIFLITAILLCVLGIF